MGAILRLLTLPRSVPGLTPAPQTTQVASSAGWSARGCRVANKLTPTDAYLHAAAPLSHWSKLTPCFAPRPGRFPLETYFPGSAAQDGLEHPRNRELPPRFVKSLGNDVGRLTLFAVRLLLPLRRLGPSPGSV